MPMQTFRAAGFSINAREDPWRRGMVEPDDANFNKLAFSYLNAKLVRWWYGGNDGDLTTFLNRYVNSGAWEASQARGEGAVNLLAPGPLNSSGSFDITPRSWHTSTAPEDPGFITETGMIEHPQVVAAHIRELRDEHGMVIHATGQLNEPCSAWRTCVHPEDYAFYVKSWRDALDAEGLQDVKVIGLEWQPPRGQADEYASIIDADPEAAAAMAGPASHSYGFTFSDFISGLARKNNWDYWQTESGGGSTGSKPAAKFLSDLNRGCTHWTFFIGPHTTANSHTLLAPPNSFSQTYWAMKLLWNGLVPGTAIHHTVSDLDGTMKYERGGDHTNIKLHVGCVAGKRPDGKWVIGLSNITGNGSNQFTTSFPAEEFAVKLQLPEPVDGLFDARHVADSMNSIEDMGTLGFSGGEATMRVPPRDVVVLVQR